MSESNDLRGANPGPMYQFFREIDRQLAILGPAPRNEVNNFEETPNRVNEMALLPAAGSSKNRRATNALKKSTCVLCSHPVLVGQDTDSEAALEWSRLIKTLCYHMQVDSREVPQDCTTEAFPLCRQCEQHAFKLYESQKKIDEAQKTITKTISTIERTVADAEILRVPVQTGSTSVEGQKLHDTILEGYRAKLLMKAKLREQLILGNGEGRIYDMPSSTHNVFMHDPSIRRQFKAVRSGQTGAPFPSTSQSNSAARNERVIMPAARSPAVEDKDKEQDGKAETSLGRTNGRGEVPDSNTPENQLPPTPALPNRVRMCRKPTSVVPAAAASVPPMKYNENSCTMTISNVLCGSPTPSPSLDPTVVVKQEPGSPTLVPVQQGKRKRRSLFQGIEILKISDSATKKVYLQCSICRFNVLFSIPWNSEISPHQTMTQHITETHLSKKRRRAALEMAERVNTNRRRQFTCKVCSMVHPDMKSLIQHKSTHSAEEFTARETANAENGPAAKSYYIPNLQCNICGRPIKGNMNNLEAHKFSHKNAEERAEAIKKNERGARNAAIRRLGMKACKPGDAVAKEDSKKVRRVKKGRRGKAFPVVATTMSRKKLQALILKERPSSVNGSIHCRHCPRTFNRNCHFVLHMQMHYRRNKAVAVTQAAASASGSASVRDPEDDETQVEAEKPPTGEEQESTSADEVLAEFSNEEIDNYLRDTDNPNVDGDEVQV